MQQHAELADSLAQYLPGVTAYRLHGALLGTVCAGWPPADGWSLRLAQVLELDIEQFDSLTVEVDEAVAVAAEALADPELDFDLGMPSEDDMTVADRMEALAQWCDGFLLAYAAASRDSEEHESDESAELIEDVSRVLSTLEEGIEEVGEEDDDDILQVEEFLRMAAISLFLEHAEPLPEDGDEQMLH